MRTNRGLSPGVNARALLLPYLLTLVVAMVVVQIVIAATGDEITLIAGVLTALVALGIGVWFWWSYRRLVQIRFGVVVAHAIAFVTATTSFNLHAAVSALALAGQGPEAVAQLLLSPWFGVTLVMSAAWGLGLLTHLAGAVAGRGWEN